MTRWLAAANAFSGQLTKDGTDRTDKTHANERREVGCTRSDLVSSVLSIRQLPETAPTVCAEVCAHGGEIGEGEAARDGRAVPSAPNSTNNTQADVESETPPPEAGAALRRAIAAAFADFEAAKRDPLHPLNWQ